MASFTRVDSFTAPAAAQVACTADVLRGHNAGQAFDMIVIGLAAIASRVRRLAARARQGMLAWDAARRQEQQDRILALSDAQTMAELNRAMNRQEGL